jgi:DNA-binding beta-propeller fold protein YncE
MLRSTGAAFLALFTFALMGCTTDVFEQNIAKPVLEPVFEILRPDKAAARTWPKDSDSPLLTLIGTVSNDSDVRTVTQSESIFGAEVSHSLNAPFDVAVDKRGVIYVSDPGQGGIVLLRIDETAQAGTSPFELHRDGYAPQPGGMGYCEAGDLLGVVDKTRKSVVVYALPAMSVRGIVGSPRSLITPMDMAFSTDCAEVYVSDATSNVIKVFSLDGEQSGTLGSMGRATGELFAPGSVTTDMAKSIYVADAFNFRYQTFTADGVCTGANGSQGEGSGNFVSPSGIAVDKAGRVFVSDAYRNDLQIFTPSGAQILSVGAKKGGRRPGDFREPGGVFIDQMDRLYVADTGNARVQIFQIHLPTQTAINTQSHDTQ